MKLSEVYKITEGYLSHDDEEVTAEDLVLFADNTSSLYEQKKSILKNLIRKHKKGIYDKTLAAKLWLYWANVAAKTYRNEFHTPEISMDIRKKAAEIMEEENFTDVKAGDDHSGVPPTKEEFEKIKKALE